jgi:hypothetical protein
MCDARGSCCCRETRDEAAHYRCRSHHRHRRVALTAARVTRRPVRVQEQDRAPDDRGSICHQHNRIIAPNTVHRNRWTTIVLTSSSKRVRKSNGSRSIGHYYPAHFGSAYTVYRRRGAKVSLSRVGKEQWLAATYGSSDDAGSQATGATCAVRSGSSGGTNHCGDSIKVRELSDGNAVRVQRGVGFHNICVPRRTCHTLTMTQTKGI